MLLLLETLTLYQIYNIYLTTSVKTVDLLFLCCFILSVIIYSHFLKSLFSSMLLLLSDVFLFIATLHFYLFLLFIIGYNILIIIYTSFIGIYFLYLFLLLLFYYLL